MADFIDWTLGGMKQSVKIGLAFLGIAILGGLLAGVADMTAPGVIAGTPLSPSHPLTAHAWTAIALVITYGVWRWRS